MHHQATFLFLIFSAVKTSKTSFQIAEECTIKRHKCLKKNLCSSNIQHIVSCCGRLHHYATSFSNFSQQFQLLKDRFNLRQNAQLSNLVLKMFLSSYNFRKHRINRVSMHQLASLFSKVSPQSQHPKHRFKQCQNAPFSVLDSKSFSAQLISRLFVFPVDTKQPDFLKWMWFKRDIKSWTVTRSCY